jgi:hypothetical protein
MRAAILTVVLSCGGQTPNRSPWRAVPPPRPDLECWVMWNRHETVVCAPRNP